MNDDLDAELRRALRPVAPPDDFSARVTAAISAGSTKPAARRAVMPVTGWMSAGIAASIAIAICLGLGLEHRLQERRELAAGLEARRQVIEALRVTHAKLDLAYQTVMTQAEAAGKP